MNRYPLWKYLLVLAVLIIGTLYALPNLYGEQPAIQISSSGNQEDPASFEDKVRSILEDADLSPSKLGVEDGRLLARYDDTEVQLKASDKLKRELGDGYTVAVSLAPTTPGWLRAIGAKPMSLGLDLRGGVHFLLQVDMDSVFEDTYDRYARDLPRFLRDQSIDYDRIHQEDRRVKLSFPDGDTLSKARSALNEQFENLEFERDTGEDDTLVARLSEERVRDIRDDALKQNLSTLRNRVNELGVAEPLIQRQGQDRIVVELPGVQDTAQAKRILGRTATLQYRLVDQEHDPQKAKDKGDIPEGSELYEMKDGQPILLKDDVIASGDQLVDASSGRDEESNQPAVFVSLDGQAASKMFDVTSAHVGDPMGVLYTETRFETDYNDKGEEVTKQHKEQKVISVANIQSAFGKKFQTTGLEKDEAQELALMLRSGALSAPVNIVSERTIGPSLGADNIKMGEQAVVVGFLVVVLFMAIYYKIFGLIANAALFMNLIIIVAGMSVIQATLTLPGIAGIVLTIGMAVDANVLIFERIREELDAGNTPQSAIKSGYDKALSSILDANITTLVAALMLFGFGSGPVKGFAVTLSLGIATSVFTAVIGTRAIVNLVYGRRRRLKKISI